MIAAAPTAGLKYEPDSMSKLLIAGWLPPTDEYQTTLTHFPGNNVHPPYPTHGYFFATMSVYREDKLVAQLHSPGCDETGSVRFDLDVAVGLLPPFSGMMLVEDHHTKGIPLEVYTAHVHRKTGSYFACNITPVVGSDIYPNFRATHMENVLFMPGLAFRPEIETSIVLLNPFKVKFSYQLHLIFGDATQQQSEALELKPMSLRCYPLETIFPRCSEKSARFEGRTSLCVTSQYKQISYLMQRDRETGIVTTLDHLHAYVLH